MSFPTALPKITVIYDNCGHDPKLQEGVGFSCFIEWGPRKILFDTGGNGEVFFSNLKALGISLEEVSHVCFSHPHWDHTAAIKEVLQKVPAKAFVYLPDPFSTTLEKEIPYGLRVNKVARFKAMDEGIYSLVLKGRYWLTSIYEQAVLLNTSKGIVIITGCAHPGIIHVITAAQKSLNAHVYMVLGGFHLRHSWCCTSAKVVRQFQDLNVAIVAPCHCTGKKAVGQFKKAYGSNCFCVATGSVIQV